jgi:hypothetical protein
LVKIMSEKTNPTTLIINDNGLVSDQQLASLSIKEWMNWLVARSQQYDPWTGQFLEGIADKYELIRDSIRRFDECDTTRRFSEAIMQLIRDLLITNEQQIISSNRVPYQLFDLLNTVCQLPKTIIRQSSSVDERCDEIYEKILDNKRGVLSSYPGLPAIAVRFLTKFDFQFSKPDLEILLSDVSTARAILPLCLKSAHSFREKRKIFATFSLTCFLASKPIQVNSELIKFWKSDDINEVDLEKRMFIERLKEDLNELNLTEISGDNIMELPAVQELYESSPMLNGIKSNPIIKYDYEWYAENNMGKLNDQRESNPEWVASILTELNNSVSNKLGIDIRYQRSHEETSWDEKTEEIENGVIALDPYFLTPRRSRSVSVVPFGFVPSFYLIYVSNSELDLNLIGVSSIEKLLKQQVEIGYIVETSAYREFKEIREKEGFSLEPDGRTSPESLAKWLISDSKKRVAIIDWGFRKKIEAVFNSEKEDYSDLRNANMKHIRFNYRNPPFAGIAYPKFDRVWGEILRDVIDKVLYQTYQIHNTNSGIYKLMEGIGVISLTSANLDKVSPWVPVEQGFFPTSVTKEFNKDLTDTDQLNDLYPPSDDIQEINDQIG